MSVHLQSISTMQKMEVQEKPVAEPLKGPIAYAAHFQEFVFGSQDKTAELILENKDNCFMAYRFTFSTKDEKPCPSIVSLYGPSRTLAERLERVMERMKKEKLILDLFIFLLAVFAAGIMAGGIMAGDIVARDGSHHSSSGSRNATKGGKHLH